MARPFRTKRARRRFAAQLLAAALLLVITLVTGALGTFHYLGLPGYDVELPEVAIETTPAQVARGRRLAGMICGRCHGDGSRVPWRGRELVEWAPTFGPLWSANITAHRGAGIGRWSDAEIAALVRTGVHPKKERHVPWMLALPRIADSDLAAILAFLRSDDAWVMPDSSASHANKATWAVKWRAWTDWSPSVLPAGPIARPSVDDPSALGRYLVEDLLACGGCHAADADSVGVNRPDERPGHLGGGLTLADSNGKRILSANITFDPGSGIGEWTLADFRRALVEGFRPDGSLVRWPMPRFAGLDDGELAAIYAYLRQVPGVAQPVARASEYRVIGPRTDLGRHVWLRSGCHYCHGEDGRGLVDLGPLDRFVTDTDLAAFIADPASEVSGTSMPSWRGVLNDDELRAVAGFARSLTGGTR